ncbi:LysR family transcriptional regulator [Lachnoclostridium phytofermentans]|uniref:Transcriptional regulator, LysR family n=1 Tax=Lachnoclostridium phytofermentans (strain ATCC 700394 / DSM 18823 / ISDg) TaxID=357809 RepID=A9KT84_LACP7|nr:LysR family transcriptional regulator [Lachnoclostridium phytofermentans]ABX43714.1 transcriptional regulator, LysR family [Lachnoclostridium phytofermentans ISDg]
MEVDFSLSAYRIFNAVAKTENISLAAKELYISQPAISKAIAKLEQSMSVALFTRNSRGVKLTEEGKQLYCYTRTAFETLKEGEDAMKRIHQLGIGHIRIGVSTTLCKFVLLPFLKEFVDEYPHIRFTIQCQSTLQTLDLIEEGKLDIGLVGKPDTLKGMVFKKVGEIQDIFIATNSYLDNLRIREGRELTGRELLEKGNLMLLDEKNITRMYIDEYFAKRQLKPVQILEVSSMDLLIEFAKTSLGIACVIGEFVKNELDCGELTEISLPGKLDKREIGFVYMKERGNQETVRNFVQKMEELICESQR